MEELGEELGMPKEKATKIEDYAGSMPVRSSLRKVCCSRPKV